MRFEGVVPAVTTPFTETGAVDTGALARNAEWLLDGGMGGLVGTGTTVGVCFSAVRIATAQQGCTGDTDEANAEYRRGNLVTVTVSSDVPLIVSAIFGGQPFTVTAESTVLINN